MNRITSRIYLGDVQAASNLKYLEEHGIVAIVRCLNRDEQEIYPRFKEFMYYDIVIDDNPNLCIDQFFIGAINFINDILYETKGNVLIHCRMGISRSATIMLAYLIFIERMSLAEAYKHVYKRRRVQPNTGFMQQLINFDNEINFSYIGLVN